MVRESLLNARSVQCKDVWVNEILLSNLLGSSSAVLRLWLLYCRFVGVYMIQTENQRC